MTDAERDLARLRSHMEDAARRVVTAQRYRNEWRTVVAVQDPLVSGRGGTCTVEDGIGRQSFGVRWLQTRPLVGDVVLIEIPPPGGTRRIVAIDREF